MVDDKLERFLKSWIDGELEPDQAAEVAAYLKANPSAQARVSDYRNVAAVIRKVTGTTPVPMPRPDVIRKRALRIEQEERQVIRWLQRLTAAAAILLVTTVGLLLATAPRDAASSVASEAVSNQPALLDPGMILALNDPSWEMSPR